MEIPAALQTLLQTPQANSLNLLKLLKPGMLLQAKVSASTLQGIARLQIGANELQAQTQIPLQRGESLNLRVEKGLPQPELKLIQANIQNPVDRLLKHALTRQIPADTVQQALRQITQLLRQPANPTSQPSASPPSPPRATTNELLPPSTSAPAGSPVKNPIQQILKVLVPPLPADKPPKGPQQIQQAFQQSGLFFENTLLNGHAPISTDKKLQLLQLLRLFNPHARAEQRPEVSAEPQTQRPGISGDQVMNRLLRLIEGSLARIQHQQVASLPDDSGKQVWHFELPLQLNERKESLALRIRREQQATTKASSLPIWKVDIEFNFDTLGQINAQVALRDEQFSVAFWSQNEATAQTISKMADVLSQQLYDAGLEIHSITSVTGQPPETPGKPQPRLLDERA